jgi:hypothetical protein
LNINDTTTVTNRVHASSIGWTSSGSKAIQTGWTITYSLI